MKALLLFAFLMSCGSPSGAEPTVAMPRLCQDMGCVFMPNSSCQCDEACQDRVPTDCCSDFYRFCGTSGMALVLMVLLLLAGVAGAAACACWQWGAYKKRSGRTSSSGSGGGRGRSYGREQDVPPAYSEYQGHVVNPIFNPDLGEGGDLLEPWSESPN
jgi:hypothetical protein